MSNQSNQQQIDEVEANKQNHRELFNNWLNDLFLKPTKENKKTTSLIISNEKAIKIIQYLKNEVDKPNSSFKFYVKNKKFNLVVDDTETLSREIKGKNLPIATKEQFFDILYKVHCLQRSHCGINKTFHQIKQRFHGLPKSVVRRFVNICPICNMKSIQTVQPRINPIRSNEFWSRIQLDLVDMRHNPVSKDGKEFKWIAHVECHFSKYHVLWAMENKSAEDVVNGVYRYVLCYFGLPGILQCDNGKEFKNTMLKQLIESWEGNCKIIHGRPRHPQSQGLVEQANGTLERMISSEIAQTKNNDWVEILPKLMYNLNTQIHSATKFTPFQVVFSVEPNNGNSKKYVELVNDNQNQNEVEINVSYENEEEHIQIIDKIQEIENLLTNECNKDQDHDCDDISVQPSISKPNSIREQVNKNQDKAVKTMELKHNKKRNKRTLEYNVGDYISVLVPRIDRGGSDLPRIAGIVSRVCGEKDKFYEIVTKFGILNDKLRACDLELYHGVLNFDYNTIKNKISIREAARLSSNRLVDLSEAETVCKCTGKCNGGRCSCFSKQKKCGSHCHLGVKKVCCINIEK